MSENNEASEEKRRRLQQIREHVKRAQEKKRKSTDQQQKEKSVREQLDPPKRAQSHSPPPQGGPPKQKKKRSMTLDSDGQPHFGTKIVVQNCRGQNLPMTVPENYRRSVTEFVKRLPHEVRKRMRREEKWPGHMRNRRAFTSSSCSGDEGPQLI